jgi:hypothetical protein
MTRLLDSGKSTIQEVAREHYEKLQGLVATKIAAGFSRNQNEA